MTTNTSNDQTLPEIVERYVSTTDAASMMGMSVQQLWRLRKTGRIILNNVFIGQKAYYLKEDVLRVREDYDFQKRNR